MSTDAFTDTPELLERIQRALADSIRPEDSKFLDVAAALEQMPGVEAVDRLCFRHHEYVIRVGMMAQLELTVAALQKVGALSLVSAPEVVASLPAGEPFGVLVTRYGACPGERLRSAVGQPLRDEAVQQLRHDLQTLARHGLVHPYARGLHHCLVGSASGPLLLDDWQALRQGSPEEAAELLEALDGSVIRQRQVLQRRASLVARPRTAEVFGAERVLLPVIHPVSRQAVLDNVELVVQAGCAGLFLINQGMSQREVLELVLEIRSGYPSLWVGVNLLGLSPAAALHARSTQGAIHSSAGVGNRERPRVVVRLEQRFLQGLTRRTGPGNIRRWLHARSVPISSTSESQNVHSVVANEGSPSVSTTSPKCRTTSAPALTEH